MGVSGSVEKHSVSLKDLLMTDLWQWAVTVCEPERRLCLIQVTI